jgi:hypothetical protein
MLRQIIIGINDPATVVRLTSHFVQRLINVGNNIFYMFNANRDSDQVFGYSRRCQFFGAQLAMCRGRRVTGQ